jgi:hypothetical protein
VSGGDFLSVDPEQIGVEGVGVDFRKLDGTLRILFPSVATTCCLEELRCFRQEAFQNCVAGRKLRLVIVDDDDELPGEVGNAVIRSVYCFHSWRPCALTSRRRVS